MSGFGFRVSFPFCVVFFWVFWLKFLLSLFGFCFMFFVGLIFGFFWLPVFLVGLRGFS